MGAASANYTSLTDPRNATYRLSKLSGTSQATPQVAGVLACLAQIRPWMDQSYARLWLTGNSLGGILDQNTAGGTGYTNFYYLQGGANTVLNTPFNTSDVIRTQGNIHTNAKMRAV